METGRIIIEQKAVEPFMKNGYLAACSKTRKAVYIDPGDEVPQLIDEIHSQDFDLVAIFNTHGHIDHISGIHRVKESFDIPVYLHKDDERIYQSLPEQSKWFGLDYGPAPKVDSYFVDHGQIRIGDLLFKVHHTPGHSPGSVSLEVENYIFCGDLIFAGAVGRTDLPGGSYPQLIQSIRNRILPLGDAMILLAGHGMATTIGEEARSNPFLQESS
jgi:glyoxylase-like metal-dependent hydrolase (beta-lactamase superfamily II)